MSILSQLRELALLRRIAISHERSAAALESIALSLRTHWKLDAKHPPRATEFSSLDIEAATKDWMETQESAAFGAALEDRTRT